jgi:hypothetical protein
MPTNEAGWGSEPPVLVSVVPRRDRRRRAPGGAARHQLAVVAAPLPGTFDRAVIAGHVGRAHGELVHVGLAQHDRAGRPQLRRDGRFVLRLVAIEDVRAGGGQHALGAEQVLDGEGDALEQPRGSLRPPRVRRLGHGARLVRRLGDEGVEAARLLDRGDMRIRQLGSRECLAREAVQRLGNGEVGEGAHSTTFGTAKKPPAASGALARILSRMPPSVTSSLRALRRMGRTEVIGSTPLTST